jgi:O-antigen ligase
VAATWKTGMKKLLKTENLIWLTLLGLPLYLIRFSFIGIPTNILDALETAVIISWIFSRQLNVIRLGEFMKKNRPYLISLCLILIGLVTSLLLNPKYQSGAGLIKSLFLLPTLFLLVGASVLDEQGIKKAFRCLLWSVFAVASLSLVYYLIGQRTFDGRLQGIFNSPNYLAMYLAPGIIIALNYLKENKRAYSAAILIMLYAFYLTYSYAAWIALALALGISAIIQKKVSWKKTGLAIIIAAIFIIFQFKTSKWSDFSSLSSRSSFSSRIMIWRSAGKIIADNPLWGIGAGNFQDKYLAYQKFSPPYLEWAVPHPHSLYLAFLLQSGLFGLAGFLFLLVFWLRDALLSSRKQKNIIINMSLAIMLYILIHGLVDTTYFKNDLAVIFWLNFLGILKKPPIAGTIIKKENNRLFTS